MIWPQFKADVRRILKKPHHESGEVTDANGNQIFYAEASFGRAFMEADPGRDGQMIVPAILRPQAPRPWRTGDAYQTAWTPCITKD